jgi:dienelactone hydrolase
MSAADPHPGCCPPGAWPALLTDYKPVNSIVDIGAGQKGYVAGTGSEAHALIVLPDIFGVPGGRAKAICDQLAGDGFFVVMPDLFGGDDFTVQMAADFGKNFAPWCARNPWSKIRPAVAAAVDFAAAKGAKKIATVGFCYGTWAGFHASGDPVLGPKINAGVNYHPSLQLESMFYGGDVDKLAATVSAPQLMVPVTADPDFNKPGGSVVKILQAKFGERVQSVVVDGQAHGYVIRGDVADATVKREVQLALERGVSYLRSTL